VTCDWLKAGFNWYADWWPVPASHSAGGLAVYITTWSP